ncbi:AmmeMemoRadiSam system protein B [Pseudodesulfovibrio sp. JC047]|uniref:AmmeMemoRadiSam system protein B n=1 Tax=Pseudodesulfovibrio sp. JC047 TaxID=2683199 RepID=UPI0013D71CA5|nr:AmmeMemoRadiSam system protein B [Pseudodesulfovibrio sp. JC047]NDV17855.1 AmmeMemoRadiSam system protein B [Pseudodesulfovibrio sp. JC047]
MERHPVVAGRFYDADPELLCSVVDGFLNMAGEKREAPTRLAMVPHAGYVYSGAVCGTTLGMANLAPTILLLGPNHTGLGDSFSLWGDGNWHIPGASLSVDVELAEALLMAVPLLRADRRAHQQEHSIEVILPFLHRLNPRTTIVPITIASSSLDVLRRTGQAIGQVLASFDRSVSIVVSSDMSHYIAHDVAKAQDALALNALDVSDPAALFETVRGNDISMCGVLPMTTGMFAVAEMGATHVEVVSYATSGEVSGDFDQVVGYAGVLVS